jgi:hypothetical protein
MRGKKFQGYLAYKIDGIGNWLLDFLKNSKGARMTPWF